jgi:hypothetical protein
MKKILKNIKYIIKISLGFFVFLFLTNSVFAQTYKCSITNQISKKIPSEYFGLFVDTFSIPNQPEQRLNFFTKIKQAGINSIRLQLTWAVVERPKDNYDWSFFDSIFKDIETAHLEAVPILVKIPVWAIPKDGPLAGKNVILPEYYPDWIKFNSEAVKRYSKNIGNIAKVAKNWEIWNEPELSYDGTPHSMVEILNLSYETIKKTDPQAKVWAPSTSTRGLNSVFLQGITISPDFFYQIVKNGKFDGINIHLYQQLPLSIDLAKKTKDYLLKNGNSVNKMAKLTVTETNEKLYPCNLFNSKTEEEQANLIVDRYLCLFQAGANYVYYFMALDLNPPQEAACTNSEKIKVGLFNPDLTPRKSYFAIKKMISLLRINDPLTPTPTPNLVCICQTSGICSNQCSFDKLTGVTYPSSIKCNLSSSFFSESPSVLNKNNWCQRSNKTKGDANGDNKINYLDYFYYVSAVSGGKISPSVNPDFNGDGVINTLDRQIIVKTLNDED